MYYDWFRGIGDDTEIPIDTEEQCMSIWQCLFVFIILIYFFLAVNQFGIFSDLIFLSVVHSLLFAVFFFVHK